MSADDASPFTEWQAQAGEADPELFAVDDSTPEVGATGEFEATGGFEGSEGWDFEIGEDAAAGEADPEGFEYTGSAVNSPTSRWSPHKGTWKPRPRIGSPEHIQQLVEERLFGAAPPAVEKTGPDSLVMQRLLAKKAVYVAPADPNSTFRPTISKGTMARATEDRTEARWERLARPNMKKAAGQERERAKKEELELAKCTFSPELSAKSRLLAARARPLLSPRVVEDAPSELYDMGASLSRTRSLKESPARPHPPKGRAAFARRRGGLGESVPATEAPRGVGFEELHRTLKALKL